MKVFLVDDEKGIVDGLKKIISRYIPECEIVGEAYNGVQGVSLIPACSPDIVITDIRMPQADGLEMIAKLKDAGCQAKFILLSGYADFEYARKGMRLGVQFYLNKPVEEEELRDCVCKVMEAIREEHVKKQELDLLKNRMLESTMCDIVDAGSDNPIYVGELLRLAHIPMEQTGYACALLEFDNSQSALTEQELNWLFGRMDQLLKKQGQGVFRFRYSAFQIAILLTTSKGKGDSELIPSMHNLKEEVFRELQKTMTVGVGTAKEQAVEISLSFEEARQALSYKVIQGDGAVISYANMMNLVGGRLTIPEELIEKLEAALDNTNEKECVNLVREIFRRMEAERHISPTDLQLQCLNILLSSVRKMSFQQLQQNELLGRHILSLEAISRFRTLERLEVWMIEVIQGIINFKLKHNMTKKKDVIAEIKKYVTEHYNESISLAELSTKFFINPYYLSQLFKQKTGDTYLNFLAQIRINKAKELLEKTDLKVYEICETVGYSDTPYFARQFEKLTGFKPSEYRKNALKN
ncbi:response regulator [Paenibacillus aestuarii]|uniref:Response regulator n=1 Tax=Paenibacillus aestuarii TaxID=516965 RepID=A0ABW0K2I1_9BACL|nr:response regulator [Paenibacillus aestuarii]